ncbi:MAG: hypothetical protein ABL878_12950 [Burkholderiales bacterium]
MVNWVKGSKLEHPLADDKANRELLAALPADDHFRILEELSHWLDSLNGSDELKIPRVLEIIELVDQTAKNPVRKLSTDYIIGGARLQKFQEIRIWNAVFNYTRKLSDAYQHCLTRFQEGRDGADAIANQLPVITARTLRGLGVQFKWQYLRYGPTSPRLREQLGSIYRFAEEKGLATSKVVVYPGAFGESTIQRETLKSLMLAMSSTDSLLPNKLHIAERIVAQFSEFFVMQRRAGKGCHFFFDLSSGNLPARLVSRLEMTPGLRFFGPGTAADELANLISQVERSGVLPSRINLGGEFDSEVVLEVLRHLARYWSPIPVARTSERHKSVFRISVVHNFKELVAAISGVPVDASLDNAIETWTVENESEGGYGALLPFSQSDWLKIGSLIGVKIEDGAAWGVGVVRRLSAFDLKQRYVGIQLLSRGGSVVKVSPSDSAGDAPQESAVLLPSNTADSSTSREMNLLFRRGACALQKSMDMRAYDREYMLVPRKLIESGDDFDMFRVRVAQI